MDCYIRVRFIFEDGCRINSCFRRECRVSQMYRFVRRVCRNTECRFVLVLANRKILRKRERIGFAIHASETCIFVAFDV